jgi:hypothetical protein
MKPILCDLDGRNYCIRAPEGFVLRKSIADWADGQTHTVVNFELIPEEEAEAQAKNGMNE